MKRLSRRAPGNFYAARSDTPQGIRLRFCLRQRLSLQPSELTSLLFSFATLALMLLFSLVRARTAIEQHGDAQVI
jgi:hypothetical protein